GFKDGAADRISHGF
uniref:Myoactive tetradecapeptide n=1 Tax=Eisenia fetida TaxID=6396 RepID=MY14_EISFE|nr:RecName: Full=Myoactive tetradecapeptide; Short=ETP [Eisenia fetida]AAB47070.1 Eisenia tetradecapeptide, ETP=bioactive tetradecapeptide [Eisenia foetida=earthworms, gut, Peptide, 14 aa] [Eisenia fetida]